MKIRIKHVFVALAAMAMVFAGCSKEDSGAVPGPGEIDDSIAGYISVAISTPKASTRTQGPAYPGNFVPNDDAVRSITLVLTNSTGVVQTVVPSAAENTSIKVAVGTYDVYAIVNPSGQIANIAVGDNINTVIAAVTEAEIAGYSNATAPNGFLMFNANDLVDKTVNTAWKGVSITRLNTPSSPAMVAIKVDRLVSAMQIANSAPPTVSVSNQAEGETVPLISRVALNGLFAMNIQSAYNPIQTWLASENILTHPATAGKIVLSTPATKNMPLPSEYLNAINTISQFDGDPALNHKYPTLALINVATAFSASKYVLENRPVVFNNGGILTSYDDQTTAAIFKVTAYDKNDDNTTFYLVRRTGKIYYSKADAVAAVNATNALVGGVAVVTVASSNADLRKVGLQVFEDGVMYYTYYIKDENYTLSYSAPAVVTNSKYYGIHRNSIYGLTVTDISTIGDDVPGGGVVDPENPDLIDGDDAYISVSVSVNPWVSSATNIVL